ncbi:MAG: polysaccharide deacetylase family protein [Alphaproteobacteria bacterium]|nr:polysaccharide deacetylase family protein [Alphaproteobacteria bacterium]
MRGAATFALAISASLLVLGPASAQQVTTGSAPPLVAPAPSLVPSNAQPLAATPGLAPAPRATAPSAGAKSATAKCDNPNALGVSRTVEIDTTGGPGFGFEHFRQLDFLRDHEVVLTFDDGPWPTTPAVLKALAAECVKAIFFPIGKHVTYYPEIVRQMAAGGHTIGSHTWSHADLSRAKSPEDAKAEIEKAISAVRWALEDQNQLAAPFFRFPALRHPPDMVTYLGTRNIAIFSTDMDSFDFKLRKGDQVVKSVMAKLQKHGKGIVLMHDFQKATSEAVPQLLAELKAGGYKIVHMKPRAPVTSMKQYDDELLKDAKLPTVSTRPVSSVVRDVD